MAAFSRGFVDQILASIRPVHTAGLSDGGRITVNETISRFAFFYERLRNAVDYKDEHLVRKAAIVRILKRQLLLESDSDVISERVIRELISARYIPNGSLPESMIGDVAIRIKKYQAVAAVRAGTERHLEWLRGILAVEIEDVLVDSTQEKALLSFLYERLSESITYRGVALDAMDRRLQIYLACYRSLIKADDAMVGYKLVRAYLPEWQRPEEWIAEPRVIAERLIAVEQRINRQIRQPLGPRFLRVVRPWAVSLNILHAALLDRPNEAHAMLQSSEALSPHLARMAEDRYAKAKAKLRRGTARATLYLFITKMLLALVLEVPLEWLWYKEISTMALVINLLFPPILMFFVGLLIRVPGHDNTDRIIAGVCDLLSDSPIPPREIRVPRSRTGVSGFLFTMTYAATFVLTFGLIILGLQAIGFTWISSSIFIFFLCVVSFFAYRLRITAREIVVIEPKQGLRGVIADFFFLPVLRMGQWLSRSISRINVFLFIFDFMFEAPFKLFLTVLEEWFAFLKEKKEELQ